MNATLVGALKSKTVWFNLALTVLGAADWITGHQGLIAMILPAAAPYLAIVGPIGIFLRAITSTSLAEKANPTS